MKNNLSPIIDWVNKTEYIQNLEYYCSIKIDFRIKILAWENVDVSYLFSYILAT